MDVFNHKGKNMFAQHLTNSTTTLNGAKAYKSSLNAVLDLFSMGITADGLTQTSLIGKAFKEEPVLALKCILYLRDVRQGQGNRDIFRRAMSYLISKEPAIVNFLIPHIPEIGRWKDVFELYGKSPKLDHIILELSRKVWKEDGLWAKWFPRQSKFHKDFASYMDYTVGEMRRTVAKLTKVIETQMCNRQWHEVNYESVPSIANIKYSKAFLRNDSSRRQNFLDKVLSGDKTAKATVSYPHDILNMLLVTPWSAYYNVDKRNPQVKSANALWSQLPNYMPEDSKFNILPIIDTSGSMTRQADGTTSSCLSIAAGLGIYMAERNSGSYKNLWMNFSTRPKAYFLKGDLLSEKVASLDYNNWGHSTDLDAAMQMVLDSARKYSEDAPKVILIVSDMEFNGTVRFTNYEKFKADFAALGLEMPTTIFWRVNTATVQQPALLDDKKVMLINGYSPIILKEVLNGNILDYTPEGAMRAILEPKYTFIDEALKG